MRIAESNKIISRPQITKKVPTDSEDKFIPDASILNPSVQHTRSGGMLPSINSLHKDEQATPKLKPNLLVKPAAPSPKNIVRMKPVLPPRSFSKQHILDSRSKNDSSKGL